MNGVSILSLVVFAPVLTGLLTLWLPRPWITRRFALATAGPVASFIGLGVYLARFGVVDAAAAPDAALAAWAWMPELQINLAFLGDEISLFFALLVSGVGVLIYLYARGYFGPEPDDLYRFYPTIGFFTTAMLGLVLADYTLLTLLFWEMTSISSFLLIGWDRYDKHAVKLAMQAFFTTGLGGMGLFGGVLLFGLATANQGLGPEGEGIWRWSTLMSQWETIDLDRPFVLWAFVLMFIGAGTKSAQWPFHYWLPGAMAAPTPVSAFLHSATMVKAGVFLLGKLFPVFASLDVWPVTLVAFGAVTMLYGGITAVNQHDLKRIFAYTTVSQLGLLVCMYGLGGFHFAHGDHAVAAIDFDITQIANHAFYKAPLFITAGAIGHVASRKLPELFGAFREHKAICVTMLLAGYALAAGPGTISFQAKELFLYAIVHAAESHPWLWLIGVMTVLTAACNVAIFIRLLTTLMGWRFGLKAHTPHAAPHEAPHEVHEDSGHGHAAHGGHDEHHHEQGFWGALIWLPAVPLVALQFFGGLFTSGWNAMFLPLERFVNYEGFHGHVPSLLHAITHPGLPLLLSAIAIALGVTLGLSRLLRGQHTDFFDRVYPAMYWLSVTGGGRAFRLVQTGHLRHYLIFILGAFAVAIIGAVAVDPSVLRPELFEPSFARTFEFWPGVLVGALVCATALALPFTSVRVFRVILLGACGFSVVGLYRIYQAPDLALTQLMFEIISVILFVLVLRLLPRRERRVDRGVLWRALVATAFGLVFGVMTLLASTTWDRQPDMPRVGSVLTQNSLEGRIDPQTGESIDLFGEGRGGGGSNVVNVILVDFRGFDTLGEITVLALAAMGVWCMLPRRRIGRRLEPVRAPRAGEGRAAG